MNRWLLGAATDGIALNAPRTPRSSRSYRVLAEIDLFELQHRSRTIGCKPAVAASSLKYIRFVLPF